jgi:UDP-glucose 4-epimerase
MTDLGSSIVKPPPRGRTVALSGACSFLGRNLVDVLEGDESVSRIVAIDIERPVTGGPKTRFYEVDLTVPSADERIAEILSAESVDTLVHLAFLATPTHAAAWAHELESVGTMHLLNGARQAPPKSLVLRSHTFLYGATAKNPNFLAEQDRLAAPAEEPFFADKIAAEREVMRFAAAHPETKVTVLRTAPLVGPTVSNFMTRYLSRRRMVTLMGFDPLWQFVHEVDALAALKLAVDRQIPGTFNIVGDGILPLSKVVRLTGNSTLPVPHPMARPTVATLWATQMCSWPPAFVPYLRYLCVASGDQARERLGFYPACTTEEALLDFISAQRLRDARLVREVDR